MHACSHPTHRGKELFVMQHGPDVVAARHVLGCRQARQSGVREASRQALSHKLHLELGAVACICC